MIVDSKTVLPAYQRLEVSYSLFFLLTDAVTIHVALLESFGLALPESDMHYSSYLQHFKASPFPLFTHTTSHLPPRRWLSWTAFFWTLDPHKGRK